MRTATQEEAARRAEEERALAQATAIASGVERVGARLTLAYWVEEGALTLVGYRAQWGRGERAERVEAKENLSRQVRLALTRYGSSAPGQVEMVLRRERAGWALESVSRSEVARPAEARRLAVMQHAVAAENYLQAYEVAKRVLGPLRVPEGGESELEIEVRLEDGRVMDAAPRRYEVVRGEGASRPVGAGAVGELAWLLLGFAEGLGPRTLHIRVRAEHGRGEAQVRGWVESVQVQRPEPSERVDEEFAAAYRQVHEQTLLRWREELAEGSRQVVLAGAEELALWYVGGLLGRGLGLLSELTLPVMKAVLGRGGSEAARWLRSAVTRLPPASKRNFEQLWAKVQLEGESSLTAGEREALRKVMLELERLVQTPLDDRAKKALRGAARRYYERSRPDMEALLRKGSFYPVHHRRPLEYASLFPDEDINDPRNLALVFQEIHKRINKLWERFRQARPHATADDVRKAAREIDDCFEAWYERPVSPQDRHLWEEALPRAEARALEKLQRLFPGLE